MNNRCQNILLMLCLFFMQGAVYAQSRIASARIVVLTFDDAVKSQYTEVAPLLLKYGFGATFFVCEFPPDYTDTSKYMTWQEIKQLSKRGFDIGNHTRNHKHINSLTSEELREEIDYIDRKCDSLHIPKPVNFAYPGYVTDPAKISLLKSLGYITARTGGDTVYDLKKTDSYLVPSFTPGNDLKKAIAAIDQSKAGNIVVLTIHGVPDNAHDWVSTSPTVFEAYLKYLHDNHYSVISMRQLAQILFN